MASFSVSGDPLRAYSHGASQDPGQWWSGFSCSPLCGTDRDCTVWIDAAATDQIIPLRSDRAQDTIGRGSFGPSEHGVRYGNGPDGETPSPTIACRPDRVQFPTVRCWTSRLSTCLERRPVRLRLRNCYPMLSDIGGEAGIARGHYFHQDLWAARKIYAARPAFHVDVGSRIDGFVGHLLAFMPVTVFDTPR